MSELELFALIIGIFGAFFYGISVLVYKQEEHNVSYLWIDGIKMWVSLIIFTPFILLFSIDKILAIPTEKVLLLILAIFFGAVSADLLYLYSMRFIGVSRAFPIAMTFPFFTYILSILFMGAQILLWRTVGLILVIIGITLLTEKEDEESINERNHVKGYLAAIFSSLSGAISAVIFEYTSQGLDIFAATYVELFGGSIILVIFILIGIHKHPNWHPKNLKRESIFKVVAAAFIGMTLGYLFYNYSIQILGATIGTAIATGAPLFTTPISVAFLGEKFTRRLVPGTIITVVGVWLVLLGI